MKICGREEIPYRSIFEIQVFELMLRNETIFEDEKSFSRWAISSEGVVYEASTTLDVKLVFICESTDDAFRFRTIVCECCF